MPISDGFAADKKSAERMDIRPERILLYIVGTERVFSFFLATRSCFLGLKDMGEWEQEEENKIFMSAAGAKKVGWSGRQVD